MNLINLARQQANKGKNDFPPLQEFYKQILSEREVSFIDEFTTNQQMLDAIREFIDLENELLHEEEVNKAFSGMMDEFSSFPAITDSVYLSRESIKFFSKDLTGNWTALENWYLDGLNNEKRKREAKKRTIVLGDLAKSLVESRVSQENDHSTDRVNFYRQFIAQADSSNRPWLKENPIQEDNILF